MTVTTVRLDILETLDITSNLTLEIAFDLETFDNFADSVFLINRKIFWLGAWINLNLTEYRERAWAADTVDDRESDLHSLILWKGDTEDTHRVD